MASVQIVPPNESLKVLNDRLADLEKQAQIQVTDQQSFIAAAQTKLDFEMYIRAVEEHFEPELAPLEEGVRRIKLQKATLLSPVKQWLASLVARRKAWAEQERRRAEEEQRRIREEKAVAERAAAEKERKDRERQAEVERRTREIQIEAARKAGELKAREADRLKREAREAEEREKARAVEAEKEAKAEAAIQTVVVAPAIPVVAGTANRRNWKFRISNPHDVNRRFLVPDEVAIGQEVRKLKDKAKAEEIIGGIEVWSE